MTQSEQATRFTELHIKGTPLVLYNAWDAGSANAIQNAGARAIATSSWAVAKAHGYKDGEDIPLDFVLRIVSRIMKAVDLPVSVDFEGGYSDDDAGLARNVSNLLDTGVVGVNFEDRVVKADGLYDIDRQARRIAIIRKTASHLGIPLFINARTDVFFQKGDGSAEAADEAIKRGKAYADAGASGLFIPGLTNDTLISEIVADSILPVNVMVMDGLSSDARLAEIGVARISYGAMSYLRAIELLQQEARKPRS